MVVLKTVCLLKKNKKATLSDFPRTFHSATPAQPLKGYHSSLPPTTLHPTASTAPIQGVPEGILIPKEMSRRNVSDLSSRNSEDKTASLPLVCGPANQSRDMDSRARDASSISVGLGGSSYGSKTSAERSLKDGVPLDQQLQNPAIHAAIHGQRCRANPIVQQQRWMRTFPLILKVVILKRSL